MYVGAGVNLFAIVSTFVGLSFSYGSRLQDLNLDDNILSEVYVQDLSCCDPVEPLYYAADYQDICIHCCDEIQNNSASKECYPQCEGCKDKDNIPKKKQNKTNNVLQCILH